MREADAHPETQRVETEKAFDIDYHGQWSGAWYAQFI